MRYRITHTTRYEYAESVSQCYNLAYVIPRDTEAQHCKDLKLVVTPSPSFGHQRRDYFGNHVYHFAIDEPHKVLDVTVVSEIDVSTDRNNLSLELGNTCEQVLRLMRNDTSDETLMAREFALDSPMLRSSTELAEFAQDLFAPEQPFLSAVEALSRRIFTEFKYDPEFSSIATPLQEVLEHKRGVCQDFAHLAIACLRSLGFAARYVSGYLETLPPPGKEKLVGADATHAWFAVYSPGEGWVEFDPTNNKLASEQHITTAWGRDYSDVTPLRGVIFGGGEKQVLAVSVDVHRL